jgi:hypothetical protein
LDERPCPPSRRPTGLLHSLIKSAVKSIHVILF